MPLARHGSVDNEGGGRGHAALPGSLAAERARSARTSTGETSVGWKGVLPASGFLPPESVQAVSEGATDLRTWVRFGLAMVRNRGSITFLHRADRLDALLAELTGKAGEITIFPLWPGDGKPAKRVIVRARRGIQTPTRLLSGMILHLPDGRFTTTADAILRDAAPLELI